MSPGPLFAKLRNWKITNLDLESAKLRASVLTHVSAWRASVFTCSRAYVFILFIYLFYLYIYLNPYLPLV